MDPLLLAQDVSHGGNRRPRLRNIDLQLRTGDRLALLGINGAGKSTLIQILAGALTPRSGEIRITGRRLHASRNPDRGRIGYLPQRVAIYPELSVRENLAWAGQLQGMRGNRLNSAIDDLLDKVALRELQHRLGGRLSAGMQQRLGLAQALLHRPEILILDEPTANLDPLQTAQVRTLIAEHSGAAALILATHLLDDVHALCNRVLVLDAGRSRGEHPVGADTDLMALLGRNDGAAA